MGVSITIGGTNNVDGPTFSLLVLRAAIDSLSGHSDQDRVQAKVTIRNDGRDIDLGFVLVSDPDASDSCPDHFGSPSKPQPVSDNNNHNGERSSSE